MEVKTSLLFLTPNNIHARGVIVEGVAVKVLAAVHTGEHVAGAALAQVLEHLGHADAVAARIAREHHHCLTGLKN